MKKKKVLHEGENAKEYGALARRISFTESCTAVDSPAVEQADALIFSLPPLVDKFCISVSDEVHATKYLTARPIEVTDGYLRG